MAINEDVLKLSSENLEELMGRIKGELKDREDRGIDWTLEPLAPGGEPVLRGHMLDLMRHEFIVTYDGKHFQIWGRQASTWEPTLAQADHISWLLLDYIDGHPPRIPVDNASFDLRAMGGEGLQELTGRTKENHISGLYIALEIVDYMLPLVRNSDDLDRIFMAEVLGQLYAILRDALKNAHQAAPSSPEPSPESPKRQGCLYLYRYNSGEACLHGEHAYHTNCHDCKLYVSEEASGEAPSSPGPPDDGGSLEGIERCDRSLVRLLDKLGGHMADALDGISDSLDKRAAQAKGGSVSKNAADHINMVMDEIASDPNALRRPVILQEDGGETPSSPDGPAPLQDEGEDLLEDEEEEGGWYAAAREPSPGEVESDWGIERVTITVPESPEGKEIHMGPPAGLIRDPAFFGAGKALHEPPESPEGKPTSLACNGCEAYDRETGACKAEFGTCAFRPDLPSEDQGVVSETAMVGNMLVHRVVTSKGEAMIIPGAPLNKDTADRLKAAMGQEPSPEPQGDEVNALVTRFLTMMDKQNCGSRENDIGAWHREMNEVRAGLRAAGVQEVVITQDYAYERLSDGSPVVRKTPVGEPVARAVFKPRALFKK